MHADVVEVIGRPGLDRRIQETNIEIGHAEADLDARVDLLGGVIRRHCQVGVVLGLVLAFVETAVEFVPDFPVFDVLLVATHDGADVVAPELHVLHRALARAAIGRRPGREEPQAAGNADVVGAGIGHQLVGPLPLPLALLGLNRAPLGEAAQPSDAGLLQHGVELRIFTEPLGSGGDAPGAGIVAGIHVGRPGRRRPRGQRTSRQGPGHQHSLDYACCSHR
jgi:hypothetical protein